MSPRNSGKLRSAAHRGQAEGAIGWIVLSVLAVLIILPLGAVLLQIVSPGFFGNTEKADGMSLLFEVFEKPLWYKALGNSMSLGIWTTFFGTVFGAFLANFRVKWEFKTAKLLDIAAWILMIMPSFIIAQGWVYFASGNGIARSWLHWNNINSLVFSFHGTQQVPLCLCDDQGGPGVETGTAVSGSKNEWGISVGRVEDCAGTFMHSGLLFRGDLDLYGYDR